MADPVDIASLGVAIETGDLVKGQQELGKTADAADKMAQRVVKSQNDVNAAFRQTATAGRELNQAQTEMSDAAQRIMARYDPLGVKLRALTADMALMRRELGDSAAPAVMKAFQGLEDEIGKVKGLMADAGVAGEAGFNKIAAAADKGTFATVSARRELIVLGHEALTGNFSRMPGSLMVLAERMHLTAASFTAGAIGAGLLVGAVVAVGMAALAGAKDVQKFNDALTESGNFAGMTADSYNSMAERIAASTGRGIGTAREAIQDLIKTGKVSNAEMEVFGDTIVRVHNVTGEKLDALAKDYARMSDGVAKWAATHNESMHFMTLAQYEYVKALEEAGKKEDAEIAVSKMVDEQMKNNTATVGYFTARWRELGQMISAVSDALQGLNKPATLNDKVLDTSDAVAQARARLKQLQDAPHGLSASNSLGNIAKAQADLDAALAKQQEAQDDLLEQRRQTMHNAQMARINSEGITAKNWMDDQLTRLDRKAMREKELREAHQSFDKQAAAGMPVSADKQKLLLDDINNRYKDHAVHVKHVHDEYKALTDQLKIHLALLTGEDDQGAKLTAVDKLRIETMQKLENAHIHLTAAQKANLDKMFDEAKAKETSIALDKESTKNLEANDKARQEAMKSTEAHTKTIQDQLAKQLEHNAAIGKSKEVLGDLKAAQDDQKADLLQLAAIKQLDRDLDYDRYDATMKEVDAMRQLAAATRQGGVMQDGYDSFKSMWQSIDSTAKATWTNVFEGGNNAFKKLGQTIKSSVLDLLYQMTLRRWIFQFTANATGNGQYASAGSALGQSVMGNGNMTSLAGAGYQYLTGSSVGASGASLGYANLVGASGGDGLGALISANGGWAGVSAGAGAGGAAAGALTGIGTTTTGAVTFGAVDTAAAGMGTAVTMGAAGGAAAGGTGLMAGAGAVLGAIPVAGWVALAALALYSMFSKSGGSPKTEGYYNPYNSGQYFSSQDQGVRQAAATSITPLQQQFGSIVSSMGGSSALQFGLGYSTDPKGTAPTQVHIGAGVNGQSVFEMNNGNVGRTDQELQQAIAEMGAKAILKGLQSIDWSSNKAFGAALNALGPVDSMSGADATAAATRFQNVANQRTATQAQITQLLSTAEENLTAQRNTELAAIDDLNKPLQQELYAVQDLTTAKQNLLTAYQAELNFAETLRSYIAGSGNAKPATEADFQKALTDAANGDTTARANLTTIADSYLKNALATAGSALEQQVATATVNGALLQLADKIQASAGVASGLVDPSTNPLTFQQAYAAYLAAKSKADTATATANANTATYSGPGVVQPSGGLAATPRSTIAQTWADAYGTGGDSVMPFSNGGSGIGAYADGGSFGGGLRLVGERGPELEVTGPSNIYSHSDTKSMLRGDNVVAAITALRKTAEQQQRALEAIALSNSQAATILNELRIRGVQVRNADDGVTQFQVHTV